jgi:hypothetical protein
MFSQIIPFNSQLELIFNLSHRMPSVFHRKYTDNIHYGAQWIQASYPWQPSDLANTTNAFVRVMSATDFDCSDALPSVL